MIRAILFVALAPLLLAAASERGYGKSAPNPVIVDVLTVTSDEVLASSREFRSIQGGPLGHVVETRTVRRGADTTRTLVFLSQRSTHR